MDGMTTEKASSALPAVGDRIGQRAHHAEQIGERSGVGVGEHQRCRVRFRGLHVDEMHRLAFDLGDELGEGIQPRLLRAPVELLPPIGDELPEVIRRHAQVPFIAGCWRSEAGARQTVRQVVEIGLRDVDVEGPDVGAGALGV